MFGEKTLSDVVKGIRASKRDTALYISRCIAEIKTEINSTDLYVKSNALQKLTFLHMMGYSMSWASFACVEVMSSPRFAYKRIGYLAASQGFTQDTDVTLLTTNLIKKELRGASSNAGGGMNGVYEAGLAINCLSNIVTDDLARELLPELTNLTSHPQPYLRKKAVLCLFKLFVKYPQGLRLTFARIQQCLDDPNPSVVSCAVNVVTELSDKNPKNYLHLAPAFFQLLTSSSNNWMLIKVVKLLGSLVGEEPRLARKLLDPLAAIVRSTQAKSLLYEAVYTITLSLPYCRKADGTMPAQVPDIVNLCAHTLRNFVEETDQNLKYLGLVGFGSLMSSHPRVLSAPDYRPLILACLSDEDVTIRTRALDLLTGMASRKNLVELITQLMRHVDMASGTYKSDLVEKIIIMCSGEKYALLSDFGWYLDVLIALGRVRSVEEHGTLIGRQVVEVALRVLPIRSYAVRRMIEILLEDNNVGSSGGGVGEQGGGNGRGNHIMSELLPSAGWIVGEYSHLIREAVSLKTDDDDDDDDDDDEEEEFYYNSASKGTYHAIIQSLTSPSNVSRLNGNTQAVYVQASMKVFASATCDSDVSDDELEACVRTLNRHLPVYMESTYVEVQERAFTLHELLRSLDLGSGGGGAFGEETMPGLTKVENVGSDDSSDDDDEEGEEKPSTTTTDGDLLNIMMSSTPAPAPPSKPSKTKKSKKAATATASSSSWTTTTSSSSVATKCRTASTTLKYLLVPDPMKPVSAKAQRKKHNGPPSVIQHIDLDAPVKMSVFAQLLNDEKVQRPGIGSKGGPNKITIEAVSFTQQRPMRIADTPAPNMMGMMGGGGGGTPMEGFGSDGPIPGSTSAGGTGGAFGDLGGPGGGAGGGGSSFQHSGGMPHPMDSAATGLNRHHQGDPFYLDSKGSADAEDNNTMMNNRFGTIELLDSDGGGDEDNDKGGRKKKKKKKKRKDNKQTTTSTNMSGFGEIGEADLTALSSVSKSRAGKGQPTMARSTVAAVYSSGEEEENEQDEEETNVQSFVTLTGTAGVRKKGGKGGRRGSTGKEFEGLAKVDLTTPLREDEVMPRNEHRVVPERPPPPGHADNEEDGGGKKKKKKKKNKKEKSSSKKGGSKKTKSTDEFVAAPPPPAMAPSTTSDLLDFAGLFSGGAAPAESTNVIATAPTPTSSMVVAAPTVTPVMGTGAGGISSAFDDLLDLSAPPAAALDPPAPMSTQQGSAAAGGSGFMDLSAAAPAQPLAVAATSTSKSTKKGGKRLWQCGTIKSSSASGDTSIDWSNVSLHYKTYHHGKGGGGTTTSVVVTLRVTNNSNQILHGLTIEFKGGGSTGTIVIGDVPPGNSVESSHKAGPFQYPNKDSNVDVRGTITVSGGTSSVSCKLTLSASMHLSPVVGLTQEQVMEELTSGHQWSSHSVKVDRTSVGGLDDAKIKPALCTFLKADEVEESSSTTTGTLACKNDNTNAQVRCLVKVKESTVKIDLKCTDVGLGKALGSDLKKVLL